MCHNLRNYLKIVQKLIIPLNLRRCSKDESKNKLKDIFSSWRSGSTFLADLLKEYPGTFYSYEPLHFLSFYKTFNQDQFVEKITPQAIELLRNLFSCNYTNLTQEYLSHVSRAPKSYFFLADRARTWDICW
jgi:hypothetical protein